MNGRKARIQNRQPRVIVHTVEPAGGMAWYVSELVVALARSRIEVVLLCPANFEFADKVRNAGAEVEPCAVRDVSYAGLSERILRNLRFVAKTTLAQLRLFRSGDIVHFASFYAGFGVAFFLPVFLRDALSIITAHDPLPHRWLLPRRFRWLERRLFQLPYRLSGGVVVHNETGKDVIRRVRRGPEGIFVIPHGPYPEAAEDQMAYPRFDCLRLLVFGTIREDKGLHLAIRAVQAWSPDARVPLRLTIAGTLHNGAEAR
jgi:glycosyltransferase involved in cell wall biosynthesis